MRTYLENHTSQMPPMLRFISICGPQMGYYCGKEAECGDFYLSTFISDLLADVIYTNAI